MISQVEVRSTSGQLLTLGLESSDDGLIVESIDGLDPVKATLVSSSFAAFDGGLYQSSRRETRNIIITLGLDPDYVTTSVRDLRNQLYQFFMPKSEVDLRFFLEDDFTVKIMGRVESFESVLFTAEPKVVISLICYDPDFVVLDAIEIEGETVSTSTETLIVYDGTVETGVIITLLVDRTITAFTIYMRGSDNVTRTLDFAGALQADDVLVFNTIPGSKGISLTRSAVTTSFLHGMSPQSSWLELMPGNNYFRFFDEGAAIPYTLEYTPRYGGL